MTGDALTAHLQTGATTLCRIWLLRRRDGVTLGFTDHDRDLELDGELYHADHGMTASAIAQSTGLSVDNSEASGALSSAWIREEDIAAGRYDGAVVEIRLVNWADPAQSRLLFRGSLGEVTRAGGAFRAELRSLSEALNQPQGQLFQTPCSAVLGDRRCRIDLDQPAFRAEARPERVEGQRRLRFPALDSHADRWFERGRLTVLEGPAAGLVAVIKNDRLTAAGREVELWEQLRQELRAGDLVRLEAGCDRRAETCRAKFDNILNHRGYPFIPGEDWLSAVPANRPPSAGGSPGAG